MSNAPKDGPRTGDVQNKEGSVQLTKTERAALLKCRYAGRFDDLSPADKAQLEEEQKASRIDVPHKVWAVLQRRGLITNKVPLRLTEAGIVALEGEDAVVGWSE